MTLTDEQVYQRFKNGASTWQIARAGQVQMTEQEVTRALHRHQDKLHAEAAAGGYLTELRSLRQREFLTVAPAPATIPTTGDRLLDRLRAPAVAPTQTER